MKFIKKIKLGIMTLTYSRRVHVTCTGMTDGLGAQIQAILSTKSICSKLGATYVHTPFNKIYHSQGKERDLEAAFRLGEGHINCQDISFPRKAIKRLPIFPLRNILYQIPHCHEFTNYLPELYRYSANPTPKPQHKDINSKDNEVTISVHVRRGDVSQTTHQERYTDDDTILNRIDKIKSTLKEIDLECRIQIVSQGKEEEFTRYTDHGCELLLNGGAEKAIASLLSSDILITAKSSLSYVAALLHTGLVLYEDFWHPPLKTWVNIDDHRSVRKSIKLRFKGRMP